ncbi:MAG: GNAT family N-acetyltransferase, partial [Clostridia bacterium]|nr:GNAT family N-acetyltransferase [Clostridia bacterium]
LTLAHGRGIGRQLMEESMAAIQKHFACTKISLHAQKQAVGFYEKLGFSVVSDEFLEEGVVHLSMEKAL